MGKCEPEHETIHGRVTSARELRVHTILVGVSLTRDSSCFVVGEAVNKVGSARDKRLFCVLNASMKSLCGLPKLRELLLHHTRRLRQPLLLAELELVGTQERAGELLAIVRRWRFGAPRR